MSVREKRPLGIPQFQVARISGNEVVRISGTRNVNRERERLVDSVLARVADLPEAAAYAASTRDLDWRRSGYSAGLVLDMLVVALWVVPRTSHCGTFGLLRDTAATR